MGNVNERDWKLFRARLQKWQADYMERLELEYMEILSGPGRSSEKFWSLDERMREDRKSPGVIVHNMSRSKMHTTIARLVLDEVITLDDLDGFTDDVLDYVNHFLKWRDMEL